MLDIAEGSPKAEFPDSLTLSWADELLDRLESRRVIRRVLLIRRTTRGPILGPGR